MSVISDLTTKYSSANNIPGWVIAGAGFMGYALSETSIIGPMWSVILMVAGLVQLAKYTRTRMASSGGITLA